MLAAEFFPLNKDGTMAKGNRSASGRVKLFERSASTFIAFEWYACIFYRIYDELSHFYTTLVPSHSLADRARVYVEHSYAQTTKLPFMFIGYCQQ